MKKILKSILFIIIPCMLLCSCAADLAPGLDKPNNFPMDPSPMGLEVGFYVMGMPQETGFVAYRSNKNEFDINDVTLDFCFGENLDGEHVEDVLKRRSYPEFRICFIDEQGNEFLVREAKEEYISTKYSCYVEYDSRYGSSTVTYDHYETVTVPSEIFSAQSGIIYFKVEGINVMGDSAEPETLCSRGILYKVVGNKVILSNQFFD